jgi:hypothetical protein
MHNDNELNVCDGCQKKNVSATIANICSQTCDLPGNSEIWSHKPGGHVIQA